MKLVKKAEKELEHVKIEDEVTDVICDKCGRNMVIKYGPHGKFLGLPRIPGVSKIPSLIWRRSALPARNAARILLSARPKRAESIMAVRTIRTAISCPGRNPPVKCVRNAVAILVEKGNKLVCPG